MRTIIRPAVVGLAAVGLALTGAASAEACGHHHHGGNVNVHETKLSSEIKKSFNREQANVLSPGAVNFGAFTQE